MKNIDFQRNESLEERIFRCREDTCERNRIISEFNPFIMNVASQEVGGFVDPHSDFSSIAMIAFNEAIDRYQDGRGSGFLRIAEITIKSRLIDHLRKETRFKNYHDFSFNIISENDETYFELPDENINIEEEIGAKEAIFDFKNMLDDFGLNLENLPEYTPKHRDARLNSVRIAKFIAENKELRERVILTKRIPISLVMKQMEVSRKVLENHRDYIMSVFLIFVNGNDTMRMYAENFVKEAAKYE